MISDSLVKFRPGPWTVALAALLLTLTGLDGAGETSLPADGPGVTLDEVFNIQTGVYLWRSLVLEGPGLWTPAGTQRVFEQPLANPDHPPLGRWVIGCCHDLARVFLTPQTPPLLYSVYAARCAAALMFAVTIGLAGQYVRRWSGKLAGLVAALSLALMPRVFGHAHLAALETAIGLTFTWTVLYVADRWIGRDVGADPSQSPVTAGREQQPQQPPGWKAVVAAGLLFGLALLTKIQAVLLPVPIGLWCLWQYRWRAVLIMLGFGLVGLIVFFCGWPWLWLDPIGHFREYFGSKAQRPTLYCFYLGQRYADVDVPWHYPFVMFLTTMPVGWLLLGVCGLLRDALRTGRGPARVMPANVRLGPQRGLVAGVVAFVLTFFALPGITVYDGERLFLVVYPLWAVLVGLAAGAAGYEAAGVPQTNAPAERGLREKWFRWLVPVLVVLGVGEGLWAMIRLHPCQLSYYNALVGGLAGANRLGFEPTYWRDSLTRGFLSEIVSHVPRGTTLYLAPVLHPANRIDLELLSPVLQSGAIRLDSYDDADPARADMRYVVVYRRHADPWASLEPAPAGGQLLCEVRRDGVQLAALYDLRSESNAPR